MSKIIKKFVTQYILDELAQNVSFEISIGGSDKIISFYNDKEKKILLSILNKLETTIIEHINLLRREIEEKDDINII